MLPPPAGGWRGRDWRDWRDWTSGALLLLGASGRPSVSVNFSLSTCLRNWTYLGPPSIPGSELPAVLRAMGERLARGR